MRPSSAPCQPSASARGSLLEGPQFDREHFKQLGDAWSHRGLAFRNLSTVKLRMTISEISVVETRDCARNEKKAAFTIVKNNSRWETTSSQL